MDRRSIDFKRGELLATARALLNAYMHCLHTSEDNAKQALSAHMDQCEVELERLIGNEFQLRNDIGDPVQLSLLILFMNGEEHIASERKA